MLARRRQLLDRPAAHRNQREMRGQIFAARERLQELADREHDLVAVRRPLRREGIAHRIVEQHGARAARAHDQDRVVRGAGSGRRSRRADRRAARTTGRCRCAERGSANRGSRCTRMAAKRRDTYRTRAACRPETSSDSGTRRARPASPLRVRCRPAAAPACRPEKKTVLGSPTSRPASGDPARRGLRAFAVAERFARAVRRRRSRRFGCRCRPSRSTRLLCRRATSSGRPRSPMRSRAAGAPCRRAPSRRPGSEAE